MGERAGCSMPAGVRLHSARSTSSGGRRSTSRLLARPTATVSADDPAPARRAAAAAGQKRPSKTNRASAQPAAAASTSATSAASSAEREVFGQHDRGGAGPGGAEGPEQRALADPLEAAGRERADQHQRAGRQAEERHESDGQHHPVDQALERCLHHREVQRRDVAEIARPGGAGSGPRSAGLDAGEHHERLRRLLQRARGEDDEEVGLEPRPVHLAQAGQPVMAAATPCTSHTISSPTPTPSSRRRSCAPTEIRAAPLLPPSTSAPATSRSDATSVSR